MKVGVVRHRSDLRLHHRRILNQFFLFESDNYPVVSNPEISYGSIFRKSFSFGNPLLFSQDEVLPIYDYAHEYGPTMASAKDIVPRMDGLSRIVSNSLSLSTSPTFTFHSPSSSFGGPKTSSTKQLKPFDTKDIKVLLLENINQTGQDILKEQGYQVEFLKSSLPEDQLIEKIRYALLVSFLTDL